MKELINKKPPPTQCPEELALTTPDPEPTRWIHCLDLLSNEFLERRREILALNKARRDQVEQHLSRYFPEKFCIQELVHSRPGSREDEALRVFALQSSLFQLLQFVLVKHWCDQGKFALKGSSQEGLQTLNWQITSYLRQNLKHGVLHKQDWSFLKQNIFSWYSPSKAAFERLRLILDRHSLQHEPSALLSRIIETVGAGSHMAGHGLQPALIGPGEAWRLLLAQKACDERVEDPAQIDGAQLSPVLVSSLGYGSTLSSLKGTIPDAGFHRVWAFSDNDIERFIAEMMLLWDCCDSIPDVHLSARKNILDLSPPEGGPSLFQNSGRVPQNAVLAACFPEPDARELVDAASFLGMMAENGLLLVASDLFWPIHQSAESERLREKCLRSAAVRLIVDFRQLSAPPGERLPKCLVILERCESRELRDSHRPLVIRARGLLSRRSVAPLFQSLLSQVKAGVTPGEVNSILSIGDGIRLESMAAAACQQQLRASPWVTLSDPKFYEASAAIRRNPSKIFHLGSLLRWKEGIQTGGRRGIFLEETGSCLLAGPSDDSRSPREDSQKFLFLPDISTAENPLFFIAQISSAPVQFWYRLEAEHSPGKSSRPGTRHFEQRLKLMPLIRIFESRSLLAADPLQAAPDDFSLERVKEELGRLFRGGPRGMAENVRLHELIVALERSIQNHLSLSRELSAHLFPELNIHRHELPATLPAVPARLAFDLFSHLDSVPFASHPSLFLQRLRTAPDFKVTDVDLVEHSSGGLSELRLFSGGDNVMKISGPSLLLQASAEEFRRRAGRPWRETSERLRFPTDMTLFQHLLSDAIRGTEQQISRTRDHIAVMDQIFCCLFGLAGSFQDEAARQAIRHHLSPQDSRISLAPPRMPSASSVKATDFAVPTEILQ